MARKSGVLLHVSSLPSGFSVGSFGEGAYKFIDFLSESGFSYWQVLPFCMTDECNSPYKSLSSFGANPYFIDLKILYEKGLITKKELERAREDTPYLAEYDRLKKERLPLLFEASKRCSEEERAKVRKFIESHPELYEVADFLALYEVNGHRAWQDWTVEITSPEVVFMWQFIQYEFFTQWWQVKAYANERGIKIIGDLPIYVALNSADVWANPDEFLLDKNGYPKRVAGVPPDYFSEDGQLWNNPLYNWKRMRENGFSWWRERIKFTLSLFDGVRIDHFRAFESYWSVPRGARTAKEGKWVKGAGKAIIRAITEEMGDSFIIAEDLGHITKEVDELLKYSTFPGMRVLQFAFLGDKDTPHLPHNFDKNCVAYTGTHDNNTLLGYVYEVDNATRGHIFNYFGYRGNDFSDACRHIVKSLLSSCADTVILPLQDLLVYGADTRMNTPGVAEGNWRYRVTEEQLSLINRGELNYYNKLYGR